MSTDDDGSLVTETCLDFFLLLWLEVFFVCVQLSSHESLILAGKIKKIVCIVIGQNIR